MSWPLTLLFALLTGAAGAAYGGFVADLAVRWLRISSFEGGSGYWVALMILLAFLGSTILGLVLCRTLGEAGVLRGFGASLGAVFLIVTALGALAWAQREVEPVVVGGPVDVAVEVRFPPGAARPQADDTISYAALQSGPRSRSRTGTLRFAEAREEEGRWIVPATIPLHVTEADRTLSVAWEGRAQFFRAPIPASPAALDEAWSPWLAGYLGDLSTPPPDQAFAMRYRLVRRPPPPPPVVPAAPPVPANHVAPPDDATTDEWLARTMLGVPEALKARALAVARARPDFIPALLARIRSPDHVVARDAMYLVGEMRPPPAEAGDPVRERAAEVVRLAAAIDPAAEDSRNQLYDTAFVLASGVHAAAFGLRRAGVDIRDSLRAMADASRAAEKAPPYAIADTVVRIVAFFERLDREGEDANR